VAAAMLGGWPADSCGTINPGAPTLDAAAAAGALTLGTDTPGTGNPCVYGHDRHS